MILPVNQKSLLVFMVFFTNTTLSKIIFKIFNVEENTYTS